MPPVGLSPPILAAALSHPEIPPERRGQRGRIHASLFGTIRDAIAAAEQLSPAQRQAMLAAWDGAGGG